ncbi:hypothetical protein U8V72_23675 [Priestia filamentosa]|uniref:hypothetical protein n=1 Tax=Priestia filamentosa TaxID=1402861 RepID=UPI00397DB175
MKKYYSCPKCRARHSTEAWTFKTRKELGLDNIDEADIVHMNDISTILNVENPYFCPSCQQSSLARDIYDYEMRDIQLVKNELRKVFNYLQLNESMIAQLTCRENNGELLIKVVYSDKEWFINMPELEEWWDSFKAVEEAVEYLLTDGIGSFKVEYSEV